MWRLKACPKCKGNVYLESDISGWSVKCLQCGYTLDLDGVLPMSSDQPVSKKYFIIKKGTPVGGAGDSGQ